MPLRVSDLKPGFELLCIVDGTPILPKFTVVKKGTVYKFQSPNPLIRGDIFVEGIDYSSPIRDFMPINLTAFDKLIYEID